MNRKLIFEAPRLPGGLIFTQVIDARLIGQIPAAVEANNPGLRFKGGGLTDEPVSPLRFAPECLDLGQLVLEIIKSRGISTDELRVARDAINIAETVPSHVPYAFLPKLALGLNIGPEHLGRRVVLRNNSRAMSGTVQRRADPIGRYRFCVLGDDVPALAFIAPEAQVEFLD